MHKRLEPLSYCLWSLTCISISISAAGCNRTNVTGDQSTPTGSAVQLTSPERYEEITYTPLESAGSVDSIQTRFERMPPERTGIDFVNAWDPPDKYQVMIARSFSGAGVTVGDVDNDGLVDVYFPRSFGGGRLYRNLGDFKFEDATVAAGLADDDAWGTGASFADIDNDGDLDLYVCGFDCANRLYINDGKGRFLDQATEFGLDFVGASVMMAFADYDNDGDLDGFLATNRHAIEGQQVGTVKEANKIARRVRVVNGQAVFPPDLVEKYSLIVRGRDQATIIKAGQFGRLFRNEGNGSFVEVAHKAGIFDNGLTLSATWWDYDQDGWPDLYVANDFYGPDRLYHNNQDGTFSDVIGDTLPHTPWFSMGADIGDINNDGRIDLIATDMSGTTHYKQKLGMGDMDTNGWFLEMGKPRQYMRNAVYLNTDGQRMMEVAQLLGVANSDWTWSPKFGDLDNDGDLDLFVTNGMSGDWSNSDLMRKFGDLPMSEVIDKVPPKRDANLAFENVGNLKFSDQSRSWGLDSLSSSYGAALADLDNDGDLDIVTNDFDAAPHIYRNHSATSHCIKVSLRGQDSNRYGLGALVEIEVAGRKQVRYLTMARGFMSTNEPAIHFGLGNTSKVDRLMIRWPSGRAQEFSSIAIDRHYVVTEPRTNPAARSEKDSQLSSLPLFVEAEHSLPIQKEIPFDDFARQPLLPNRLSQLGPSIAAGDVDGDGDEDMFVAGPAGSAGRICLNREGRLSDENSNDFTAAIAAEDMGAVFFDADADGDQDLYVVSGGVECEPGDSLLRDRLYLGDGQGAFSLAPEDALPDLRESGSCVATADFDRDGDLDLFVGGRVVPGQYPRTPQSFLLVNESVGGSVRYSEQTDDIAPGLRASGMVTGALWSDVDNDGWIDLLVTHEWGPVGLYRNNSGKLEDVTEAAGLADRKGWWNGLSGGDVDNDGDIDYIATNFGLNTKYSASSDHPATIYFHDFDSPGEYRIVEAHLDLSGQLVPVRGRSCSSNAMPFIAKKCNTFHDFAVSSLADLYGDRGLVEALRVDANELRSMLLKNDGDGRFSCEPLCKMAQASPGFGIAMLDIDADGNVDALLAQNFFSPQRETGRMDGGLGLVMLGDGTGSYNPMSPKAAGVVIPGDAKSALISDVDLDGVPDVVVGINDGRAHVLRGNRSLSDHYLRVDLIGKAGNLLGVGAHITAHYQDGGTQSSEVWAGSSYLSQSSSTIWFGTKGRVITRVIVRWPNGDAVDYSIPAGQKSVAFRHQDG